MIIWNKRNILAKLKYFFLWLSEPKNILNVDISKPLSTKFFKKYLLMVVSMK